MVVCEYEVRACVYWRSVNMLVCEYGVYNMRLELERSVNMVCIWFCEYTHKICEVLQEDIM